MRLFLLTTTFVAITCVNAPAGNYLWLQHAPTMVGLPALWWMLRHNRISSMSLRCSLAFVALHAVGARWIYSYVPYDAGLQLLTGTNTDELFGWGRNHYDRFVHLMYGVCFGGIAWDFVGGSRRTSATSVAAAAWLSIQWVLASSALYEIAEWLAAVSLAPDWADSYLGQQGDIWDPIKDMALAGIGAIGICTALAAKTLTHTATDSAPFDRPECGQTSDAKIVDVP